MKAECNCSMNLMLQWKLLRREGKAKSEVMFQRLYDEWFGLRSDMATLGFFTTFRCLLCLIRKCGVAHRSATVAYIARAA